jgi:hypothetical protein
MEFRILRSFFFVFFLLSLPLSPRVIIVCFQLIFKNIFPKPVSTIFKIFTIVSFVSAF